MTAIAIDLPSLRLSDDERSIIQGLVERLEAKQPGNVRRERYYAGKQRVRDLGIAIPPHLRTIETVVGWPSTVVDVLEERLDIDGWMVPDVQGDVGISEIVEDNRLWTEYGQGHLDALIYGIAFVVVGSGAEGEPHPLITIESPRWMTAEWSRRLRRVTAALSADEFDESGQIVAATFYVSGTTIRLSRSNGEWGIKDRDDHDLPLVPVVPLVNRPRTGDTGGRSEITPAVQAYTDAAVRTVLGMEVAREFFSAPQRWIMGADESAFVDKDGTPKTAWETYLGRVLAISRDEDGELPQVGQFSASSPSPYLEQLRGLATMLAAEGALPVSYLGVVQDNPSSADAIRAGEVRTIKRAERRQRHFGAAHGEAKRIALWIRDGDDPGVTPRPIWVDPSTPTRSAMADEAMKLVAAGVLPADSEVTQERVGLSETDRRRLALDRRQRRVEQTVTALSAAAEAARADGEVAELSGAG